MKVIFCSFESESTEHFLFLFFHLIQHIWVTAYKSHLLKLFLVLIRWFNLNDMVKLKDSHFLRKFDNHNVMLLSDTVNFSITIGACLLAVNSLNNPDI